MFQMKRDDDISDDEDDETVRRERRDATSGRDRRTRVSTQNDNVLMISLSINTC